MNFDSRKNFDFSAKPYHRAKAGSSASWASSYFYDCLSHGSTAIYAAPAGGLGVSVATNQTLMQVIESKDRLIDVLTIQLASHTQGPHEKLARASRVFQGNEIDSAPVDPTLMPVRSSRWTWLLAILIALGAALAWAWLGGYLFGFTLRDSDLDFSTQEPFICAMARGGAISVASGCAKRPLG